MNSVQRAYVQKDTWITNKSTTANLGLSPILEVWANYDLPNDDKYWARTLMSFNLSSLTASIVTNDYPDPRVDSTVSAYLNVFNVKHGDDQAEDYTLEVYPITQHWTEGNGLDNDGLSNTGYANAVSATKNNVWTTSGGSYSIDSNSASQYFEHGEENLKINITNMFNNWLDGTSANHGLLIKHTSAQESNTATSTSAQSTGYKKFYGRETNTIRRPYIELTFDNPVKDDRNSLEFSNTGELYFFNIVNGQLQDLNGNNEFPGTVTLSSNGSSIVSASSLTASRHSKGIYKITVGSSTPSDGSYTFSSIPFSLSSTTSFQDSWTVTSSGEEVKYNQTFHCTNSSSGYDNLVTSRYRVAFKNLSDQYTFGTKTRLRLHIKDDSLILTPLTAATTAIPNFIVKDGRYTIRLRDTNEIEVPETSLSYDKNGNYIDLDTTLFAKNYDYKIVLDFNVRGETLKVDRPENFYFKIK